MKFSTKAVKLWPNLLNLVFQTQPTTKLVSLWLKYKRKDHETHVNLPLYKKISDRFLVTSAADSIVSLRLGWKVMDFMFDWDNDGDRFSFDDSERFEEESMCSWLSETESLNNNWRGWKRQNGGQTSPSFIKNQGIDWFDKSIVFACLLTFHLEFLFNDRMKYQKVGFIWTSLVWLMKMLCSSKGLSSDSCLFYLNITI